MVKENGDVIYGNLKSKDGDPGQECAAVCSPTLSLGINGLRQLVSIVVLLLFLIIILTFGFFSCMKQTTKCN